ncbi:PfkB family carbohydrate kinase [Paenibacillus chitinolyticus]
MIPSKIVAMGEALIDMVSQQAGMGLEDAPGFDKAPGGAPANVSAAVARLGGKAAFLGMVGDDPFGYFIRNTLENIGVDVSGLLHTGEAKTALAFVSLQADGERDFLFYRQPCADMLLTLAELDETKVKEAAIFHFGSISLASEPIRSALMHALKLAAETQTMISFDLNWRPSLWMNPEQAMDEIGAVLPYVDIVKVNEEEMALFTGESEPKAAAKWFHAKGVSLVAVTLGSRGCYYSFNSKEASVTGGCPGYAVLPVDTTGAGDAFVGGLLVRLTELGGTKGDKGRLVIGQMSWHEEDIHKAFKFAVATSALTVTRKGAISALPGRDEVKNLILS